MTLRDYLRAGSQKGEVVVSTFSRMEASPVDTDDSDDNDAILLRPEATIWLNTRAP